MFYLQGLWVGLIKSMFSACLQGQYLAVYLQSTASTYLWTVNRTTTHPLILLILGRVQCSIVSDVCLPTYSVHDLQRWTPTLKRCLCIASAMVMEFAFTASPDAHGYGIQANQDWKCMTQLNIDKSSASCI